MKTKDFYQIKPQNLISVLTLVVTALMLFATAPAFSQETIIYAEGFENDNGNYTKIIESADPQFPMLTGDGLWQWGTPGWISDRYFNDKRQWEVLCLIRRVKFYQTGKFLYDSSLFT